MNTNIENCNINLLEQQKDELINEIVYGGSKDFFNVFDIEAGCRKTRTAEIALIKLYRETGKKSIFVRQFNNDCRESAYIINSISNDELAFAYNNEDVAGKDRKIVNKQLEEYPILIITHQRYKALIHDTYQRKLFTSNRSALVIDEFLSIIEKISLSHIDIDTYRQFFSKDAIISAAFNRAIHELEDFLITWKNENIRRFVDFKDKSPATDFKNLIKLLKANIDKDRFDEWKQDLLIQDLDLAINRSLLSDVNTVNQLFKNITDIKQFFVNLCLYDNNCLYTTNSNNQYWLLDNNIILDASGELQTAYSLNTNIFHLYHCEKVLDHKNWKILNIPISTTSNNKDKILNFYEIVNESVKKYGDDILVVGKKNEMSMINVPEKNKGYFGNITGSNQWYNKKHIAIIQTHNLSDIDYILKYLHYSRDYIDKNITLATKCNGRRERKIYSFKSEKLEAIRVHWIAAEIYQAIKRINRNMIYDSEVLIFMNNDDIIDLIRKQMKNCKVETIQISDNTFKYERGKQDEYIDELKKESYANKFIKLIAEIENGKHEKFSVYNGRIPKKVIREYLGIKTSGNFSNKVLNKSDVISFCKARDITVNGQYIQLKSG